MRPSLGETVELCLSFQPSEAAFRFLLGEEFGLHGPPLCPLRSLSYVENVQFETGVSVKDKTGGDTYPILQPVQKLTFKLECKALRQASAKNRAELTYDQFDSPILDEESTSIYE